jgi:hypothetical protein
MKYFVFCLFFLTLSCGTKQKKQFYVDKDFADYLSRFEFFLGYKIDDLVMVYGDTKVYGENVVGNCSQRKIVSADLTGKEVKKTPKITIKKSFWERSDIPTRELLIFHELGHCIFDRDHRTTHRGSAFPVSIMEPTLFSSFFYVKYYSYYISELFGTRLDENLYFDFNWYN